MKKVILSAILIASSLSLTSCWEFNRNQQLKDAKNNGESVLAEAKGSRLALIETAKANNESATLNAEAKIKIAKAEAQAEIERAKGAAEANEILGNSLEGKVEYLDYLKIQSLGNTKGDRIYIPTEAGVPILERR